MERAERFIYAFYATALVGVGALAIQKKSFKAHQILTWLTLVAAAGSLALGGFISQAGGEVSHSEFRSEEAPQTNEAHQHDVKPAAKDQIPATIEGIWTELHRHYTELESAATAKQLREIHPQAVAIKGLTAKLVQIDLHKAADAEDEAGGTQRDSRPA